LRELLGALEERGLLRNTIVVVTSDHGEQFGEHGLVNHGNSLYMPLLHVPLLIVAPGRVSGGQRIADWISTTEVPATIAEMAGHNNQFPGHSLSRYWDTNASVDSGHPNRVLSEVSEASGLPEQYPANHGDMISVIYDGYQLIRNTGADEELFHLATDPAQLRNLGTLENYRAVKEKLRRLSTDTASRFTPRRARPGD
jgi:arylsulfatase A-like enzyme